MFMAGAQVILRKRGWPARGYCNMFILPCWLGVNELQTFLMLSQCVLHLAQAGTGSVPAATWCNDSSGQ